MALSALFIRNLMALIESASFVTSAPIVLRRSTSLIMYSFPSSSTFRSPSLQSRPQETVSISSSFQSRPLIFRFSVASPIIFSIWLFCFCKKGSNCQQRSCDSLFPLYGRLHYLLFLHPFGDPSRLGALLPSLLHGSVKGNVRDPRLLEAYGHTCHQSAPSRLHQPRPERCSSPSSPCSDAAVLSFFPFQVPQLQDVLESFGSS